MSRWGDIQELTKTDRSITDRISLIYNQYDFPVEIRDYFSQWFEDQNWDLQQPDGSLSEEDSAKGAQLLKELLENTIRQADEIQALVLKIQLAQCASKLKERFTSNPGHFLQTVKWCLDAEILLMQSMSEPEEMSHGNENPDSAAKKLFQDSIEALLGSIETKLKPLVQTSESTTETLKMNHNRFLIANRERQVQLQELEAQLKMDGAVNSPLKKKYEEVTKMQHDEAQAIVNLQAQMHRDSHAAAESLATVIKSAWDLLDVWRTQQRLEITCLSPSPDMSHLDSLDNVFKQVNEQFTRVLHVQYKGKEEYDRVPVENSSYASESEALINNLKIILHKHIDKLFVIERQPHRIMKITTRKSLQFNMVVRMLGGASFGIHLNSPKVIARIFPEKDERLKMGLEYAGPHDDTKQIPAGIAEISNGTAVFERHRSTGNLVAMFTSYQLRKVERILNEKIGKEERVTDQKYAMVYYTKVSIMNEQHELKAVSLPLCLNTSNSQEGPSRGTLIWEAAFGLKERNLWSFADADEVLWPELVKVIQALFRRHTDRELTAEQLGYLVQRLTGVQPGMEATTLVIRREKFLKENLPNCSFTFWKWVYACLNLIRMRLKSEWKDGLIFGFIGRDLTKALLKGQPRGTFLLRFSDTSIEESQSSEVPGCLTVAVIHENPKKLGKSKVTFITDYLKTDQLRKHGLATILDGYCYRASQENEVLRPLISKVLKDSKKNANFKEAFAAYLKKKEEKKDGYAGTKMKIEVDLEDYHEDRKNTSGQSAGAASAATPGATGMTVYSPYDPMSPGSSIVSDTTSGSMMSPGGSVHGSVTTFDERFSMMGIVPGSPSDASEQSQALSPTMIHQDEELQEVQLNEDILAILESNNITLDPQQITTTTNILSMVQSD